MIAVLSILLATLSVFAFPSKPSTLIVGGQEVVPFQYPWLVSIETHGFHYCGGVLLDMNTVLTAAHCELAITASDGGVDYPALTAVAHRHDLGSNVTSEKAVTFSVSKITKHPLFEKKTMAFDVAVWQVDLNNGDLSVFGNTSPVDLIHLDDGTFSVPDSVLTIAGWGSTTTDSGSSSSVLLETTVKVIDQDTCKRSYDYLDNSSLCASNPGRDSCEGDSGGPAFVKANGKVYVVGIISFGEGCADSRFPGVYSRISESADWIKANAFK